MWFKLTSPFPPSMKYHHDHQVQINSSLHSCTHAFIRISDLQSLVALATKQCMVGGIAHHLSLGLEQMNMMMLLE